MGVFRIEEADRPHLLRLLIIWVVLSIVGILAALQILYPPYDQSVQGLDQSRTLALLTVLATPVFIGVVIMVLYSAIYFRRKMPRLPRRVCSVVPCETRLPVPCAISRRVNGKC